MSAARTQSKMYDVGDDFGAIVRYVLDYHTVEAIDIGEWD